MSDKINEVENKVINLEKEFHESRNKSKVMDENHSKNVNQINERMSKQLENMKQNKANGLEEHFRMNLQELGRNQKEQKKWLKSWNKVLIKVAIN